MDRRERLYELHLALEGAVDQLTRAQRLSDEDDGEIDEIFARVVAVRNRVREALMKEMAAPPKVTIRKGK